MENTREPGETHLFYLVSKMEIPGLPVCPQTYGSKLKSLLEFECNPPKFMC